MLLIASSCSSRDFLRGTDPVPVSSAGTLQLAPPDRLGRKISAVQKFTGEYQGRRMSFLAQMEASPERLVLVGLSSAGTRLFTMSFSRKRKIAYKPAVFFRAPVRPAFVLADVQLMLWPVDVLRSNLSPGLTLTQSEGSRPLRQLRAGDRTVLTIQYADRNPWKGRVSLRHHERKYGYTITTLSSQKL